MAVDRKHEIIEIDKIGDLADSYFIRRGIIYSRDCDNNRLNVWIEGTLFENLEIFYHCENETESTPHKAFDLFEVGRKVLVLHEFVYNEEDSSKVDKIERTVIGLKYNSPEGINNLQPCIVKRFFAKVGKVTEDPVTGDPITVYSYHWIYINDEDVEDGDEEDKRKITVIEINNNEDKTEAEVFYEMGFFSELEKALYLGNPLLNPLSDSATKSFMMTNDKGFRERWVATPCSLFKDQCEIFKVSWTSPPPCALEELPCPSNRFYCNIEKRILVWYGSYSTAITANLFMGASIIRFNTDNNYTLKNVAVSGVHIDSHGEEGYRTLLDTEWDIPLNIIPDIKEVDETTISFYLPSANKWRSGFVKIDWIHYEWGYTLDSGFIDETKHWYWSENGFEQKVCALFEQEDLDGSIVDDYDFYENDACRCTHITTQAECVACNEIMQDVGKYQRTVNICSGYTSLYTITLFDELLEADTLYRNIGIWEGKIYNAHRCTWNESTHLCHYHGTIGYNAAKRNIGELIEQKKSDGLSASWQSNNVAYFFKEKNRDKCDGSAQQLGKTCAGSFGSTDCIHWAGPNQSDFDKCSWVCDWPAYLCAEDCPDGLGKCFELDMPGDDWSCIENDYVETIDGPHYRWHRDSDRNDYEEPIIRKFKIDEEIEFDATEIYKTYYLDDRATCHEQGLVVAGKGVRSGEKFWEVYHDGIDITKKLFEALGCEQSELDEIGLI